MKYLFTFFIIALFSFSANASTIKMFGKKKYGFEQPKYILNDTTIQKAKELYTLANHNAFPFSSEEQGSAFLPLIKKIAEKSKIYIKLVYNKKGYEEDKKSFERGNKYINALFAVPQEFYQYSKNEYLYPAFFENKLHVITIRGGAVVINNKEDLHKYKGGYINQDSLSSFIIKDFSKYKMASFNDYATAFEKLFTKKVDYLVAGYYPSQIEAYKIGIRDYISYSKDAIWKNPLFIRINYKLNNDPNIEHLKRYMRTEEFKETRDKALEDVLEIYKKNTQGIVPPMYIGEQTKDENLSETVQ